MFVRRRHRRFPRKTGSASCVTSAWTAGPFTIVAKKKKGQRNVSWNIHSDKKKTQLWRWNTSSTHEHDIRKLETFSGYAGHKVLNSWCHAHSVTRISWLYLMNLTAQRLMTKTDASSQTPTSRSWIWRFCGDLNTKMYGKSISFVS